MRDFGLFPMIKGALGSRSGDRYLRVFFQREAFTEVPLVELKSLFFITLVKLII